MQVDFVIPPNRDCHGRGTIPDLEGRSCVREQKQFVHHEKMFACGVFWVSNSFL